MPFSGPVCHLVLISCLFLKSETVDVYKNQIIECAVNIKNSNHVVCSPALTRRSVCVCVWNVPKLSYLEGLFACVGKSQIRIDGITVSATKTPFRSLVQSGQIIISHKDGSHNYIPSRIYFFLKPEKTVKRSHLLPTKPSSFSSPPDKRRGDAVKTTSLIQFGIL